MCYNKYEHNFCVSILILVMLFILILSKEIYAEIHLIRIRQEISFFVHKQLLSVTKGENAYEKNEGKRKSN